MATTVSEYAMAEPKNCHKCGKRLFCVSNIGELAEDSCMRSNPSPPATGDSTEVWEEHPSPATATTGRHGGFNVYFNKLLSPKPASGDEQPSTVSTISSMWYPGRRSVRLLISS